MDLIDREATLREMEVAPMYAVDAMVAYDVLKSAPKVDAVPVKYGAWCFKTRSEMEGYDPELSGNDEICCYICTNCQWEAPVNEFGESILSRYCPHCGAQMFRTEEDKKELY